MVIKEIDLKEKRVILLSCNRWRLSNYEKEVVDDDVIVVGNGYYNICYYHSTTTTLSNSSSISMSRTYCK
jgi:hypothetical protein